MIAHLRRWIRVVLPFNWIVWTVAFCWFVTTAASWPLLVLSGGDAELAWEWRVTQTLIFSLLAMCYGLYRVRRFHPAHRSEYYQWLLTTPWRVGMPLPLGPVHLAPQDALIVGLLTAPLLWRYDPLHLWVIVPFVFLAAYLLHATFTLAVSREWPTFYALFFGLPLPVLLLPHMPVAQVVCAALMLLAVLALVAQLGLSRSLRTFPWKWGNVGPPRLVRETIESAGLSIEELGWPWNKRNPRPRRGRFLVRHVLLASLAAGWYLFLIMHQTALYSPEKPDPFIFLTPSLILFIAGLRLVEYTSGYRAPISFLGRLATGHWIIPRYDQVYVAPLLGVLAGVALPLLFWVVGLSFEVNLPLTLVISLFILGTVGPSPSRWELTGGHRQWQARTKARG